MTAELMLVLATSVIFAHTSVAGAEAGDRQAFQATYRLYAGELGEETAPTQRDRKMAVEITGRTAKEMFDSMSPDFQPACSGEKGDRDRRKGNLFCTYSPAQGYRCFLSLDLRTGKLLVGASC